MIVTPLDVTFNPDIAVDYYNQLEQNWQQLKWEIPGDYFYEAMRGAHGWDLMVPKSVDRNTPFGLHQSITIMGRENYQETDLVFGFGKYIVDLFPFGYRFSIAKFPPRAYVAPHTDGDKDRDALRVWIPIVTNPGVRWITEEGVADLRVGHVYIIDIGYEHEFFNDSEETGVVMVFDVKRTDLNSAKLTSGKLF